MHGNVSEWCLGRVVFSDDGSFVFYGNKIPGSAIDTSRCFRGGDYSHVASACSSLSRIVGSTGPTSDGGGYVTTGFRLVVNIAND